MHQMLNLQMQSPHGEDPPLPPPIMRIPFIGRIRFLRDREGMTCVGITFLYWLYGSFASLFLILLPQYREGVISLGFIIVYSSVSLGTIVSLYRAATINPGRVPPVSEIGNKPGWIACHVCAKPRPPKAHHCRRCQQCVLRMDHHCPWINNCVGEDNHYMFFLLCFFAFLLGLLTFILCMLQFWVYPKCKLCDKEAFFMKHSIWFLYLLTAMGAVMGGAMFSMIAGQHINLILDRTTLDHMQNPHQDPNELTMRNWLFSYKELCGGGSMIFWLFPCRNRPYRTVYSSPV